LRKFCGRRVGIDLPELRLHVVKHSRRASSDDLQREGGVPTFLFKLPVRS
jgi:hypothetical protein